MRRAAVALAVLLTASCGTTSTAGTRAEPSSSAPAAVPAVPGIEAAAVRLRTDEAVGGQVQVRVTDAGDTPFTVTSVALDSPGFAPLPATVVTASFAHGRVIDLPTPYGEPRCGSPALPAAADLTVVRPGAEAEEVTVPLDADILDRIHAEECAALAVTAVVDIAVTGLRDDGNAVTGSLTLTRRSGKQPVTATRISRSVLIDVEAELPAHLGAGEGTAAAAVRFTPASCDPHVLSETKQPYVFPLAVTVGDGDPVSVDLPLDQAARDELAALVQRICTPPA